MSKGTKARRPEPRNGLQEALQELTRAQALLVANEAALAVQLAGFHEEMRQMRKEMIEEITAEVTRCMRRVYQREFTRMYEALAEFLRERVGFRPPPLPPSM